MSAVFTVIVPGLYQLCIILPSNNNSRTRIVLLPPFITTTQALHKLLTILSVSSYTKEHGRGGVEKRAKKLSLGERQKEADGEKEEEEDKRKGKMVEFL